MDEERRQADKSRGFLAGFGATIKSVGFLSTVGIALVAATLIGLAMGYYLDKWLGTGPWLTLIFLVMGIVSGFRNVYILTERELKRQQGEGHNDGAGPQG